MRNKFLKHKLDGIKDFKFRSNLKEYAIFNQVGGVFN